MTNNYEKINFIDKNGLALDDDLNEFRDENGQIIIIPELDYKYFKKIER